MHDALKAAHKRLLLLACVPAAPQSWLAMHSQAAASASAIGTDVSGPSQ